MELIVCNKNEIGINSYVLKVNNKAVVIDPNDYEEIITAIGECNLDYIFLTHEHFDHIMAVDRLRNKYKAKVIAQKFASEHIQFSSKNLSKFSNIILDFMNKTISSPIKEFIVRAADITYLDRYNLIWEGYNFLFTHTPGHTKGSSCILIDDYLFSGDSLFECCDTDTKGIGTSRKDYNTITIPFFESIKRDINVYAGHYHSFILEDKLKAKEKAIQIFKSRPKYTNLFIDYNNFNDILNNCNFFVRNTSIFIIKKDISFYRFYYFVNEYEDLKNLDEFLSSYKKPIILELVSLEDLNNQIYKEIGFLPYKTYSRYSKIENYIEFDNINLAEKSDAIQIKNLIDKTFDPLSDYIPSISEIDNFIETKSLYVTKDNHLISGVAIYIKNHSSYYLRLICVDTNYRKKSIGFMLAAGLPKEKKRCIAWIDDKNEMSIKLNKKVGYKKDYLKNYIFIYNKEKKC